MAPACTLELADLLSWRHGARDHDVRPGALPRAARDRGHRCWRSAFPSGRRRPSVRGARTLHQAAPARLLQRRNTLRGSRLRGRGLYSPALATLVPAGPPRRACSSADRPLALEDRSPMELNSTRTRSSTPVAPSSRGHQRRHRPAGVDRRVRRPEPARIAARRRCSSRSARSGSIPASIHDLYAARGRGEGAADVHRAGDQHPRRSPTTPRARCSAPARALGRRRGDLRDRALRDHATPTSARPSTRSSCWRRRCARAGRGPVFLQGDHFQINAKKYASDPAGELKAVRDLTGRGDRGRLLQHRRRHLDAGGSLEGRARGAAGA